MSKIVDDVTLNGKCHSRLVHNNGNSVLIILSYLILYGNLSTVRNPLEIKWTDGASDGCGRHAVSVRYHPGWPVVSWSEPRTDPFVRSLAWWRELVIDLDSPGVYFAPRLLLPSLRHSRGALEWTRSDPNRRGETERRLIDYKGDSFGVSSLADFHDWTIPIKDQNYANWNQRNRFSKRWKLVFNASRLLIPW